MNVVVAAAVVLSMQGTILAQATSKPLEFEVASVRQVDAAPGTTGVGIVTITNDRASYRGITLKGLLLRAYDLEPFQVSGPEWIDGDRYDVLATIPEGAPKEEVPIMLQHLLTERFNMTLRSETKNRSGYILGVGKGGPKLTPAKDHKSPPSGDPYASRRPASMSFTLGGPSSFTKINGTTMPAFADFLSRALHCPVIDSTRLPGEFDIVLSVSVAAIGPGAPQGSGGSPVEPDSSVASLFTSVHDLGLILDSRKVPVKYIEVQHAQKIPTEN